MLRTLGHALRVIVAGIATVILACTLAVVVLLVATGR